MMKEDFWIMCATSDSSDHYHACGIWDHDPSQEEIDEVRVKLDSEELEPDYEDCGCGNIVKMDGKSYMVYVNDYTITKIGEDNE